MKNPHSWVVCLIFFMANVLCASAQTFSKKPTPKNQNKVVISKVYKSPAQLKAEELVKRTKPGYYTTMYTSEGWKFATKPNKTLRVQANCSDIYLCRDAALPVILISFKGSRINNESVKLYWETTNESNNRGFEVERSLTGNGEFIKVGFVDGTGTTDQSQKYGITDFNNSGDLTYYRLKQIDNDAEFVYSRIIAIAGFNEPLTLVAVPNPTNQNNIYLQVEGLKTGEEFDLVIFDVKGIVVYRNEHMTLSAANRIQFRTTSKLAAGIFNAKITSKTDQTTMSFVVID